MKKQRAGMETSRTPDSILTLDLDVFFFPPSLRPHPLVELFCTVASCAVPRRRGRRKWVTELIGGYFVLCERRVCLPPHGWSLLFLPVHDGGDHGQERLKRLRTGDYKFGRSTRCTMRLAPECYYLQRLERGAASALGYSLHFVVVWDPTPLP